MLFERPAAVGEQPRALQERVDDERLVNVEFEMAGCAAKVHRHVVRHRLRAEHGKCLGLRRIHLAGHDRAAGLVLRDAQLRQSRARSGGEQPHVIGDLEERRGERLYRAVGENERLMPAERGELVRRLAEGELGLGCHELAHARRELRVRVEARADRGAANREAVESGQRGTQRVLRLAELVDIAGELLAKRERRRVLQVRAADLDDLREGVALARERGA